MSRKRLVEKNKIIHQAYPISGIHIEDDGKLEYVMSTRKVIREK